MKTCWRGYCMHKLVIMILCTSQCVVANVPSPVSSVNGHELLIVLLAVNTFSGNRKLD